MIKFKAIILIFVFPSLIAIIIGKDFFPFFTYYMYSTPPHLYESVELQVTTVDGDNITVTNSEVLWPVGFHGLTTQIENLQRVGRSNADFDIILKYFLKRYERYRSRINLPQIKSIQFVRNIIKDNKKTNELQELYKFSKTN